MLLALAVLATAGMSANGTAEGASAALGGLGLLLISAGSVVLVRGR